MASFGQYPPPSFAPPPNQNPHQPPPPQPHPPQQRGSQYSQNWNYNGGDGSVPSVPPSSFPQNYNPVHPNSGFHHGGYGSSSQSYASSRPQHPPPPPLHHQQPPPPPPPQQQQQQQPQPYSSYPPPPPPPPVDSSYPPPQPPQNSMNLPPPAPPMYYPSSQYSQFNHQPLQPPFPPPPSSPPPSSSFVPPPPPPSHPPSPPPPPLSKDTGPDRGLQKNDRGGPPKEFTSSGRREPGHSKQKPPIPVVPVKKSNGPPGRVETEEERKLRKKREMEKQKLEEKHRQQVKESQNTLLQKTQHLSSGTKGHGSILGSRMGDRRSTPFLSSERTENRLKKPTTFLCRMKFRNELPDPTGQPKLMSLNRDPDRYCRYAITSLEKNYKPELYVEPDLGIPLDLLDLSVYNPPPGGPLPLDPEDEELLRDDEEVTPVKKDGIRRKERPTDQGFSWLVKTQYISPLSNDAAKQSLTEKQAKELRESRGGPNILDNINDRGRKIREIEASFEACKSRPVHATNKNLTPVDVFPLFPDFDRLEDQFVIATFDNAPTAESELFGKMDSSVRDIYESQAIMKSYVARGSDPANPEKFLGYMVPEPNEISKDVYGDDEISYSWIREYGWDVRGEDSDDPTTYFVAFDEDRARYYPIPRKLVLRKKRAKEGRSGEDAEQFPVPSEVRVRRGESVIAKELDVGASTSKMGRKKGRAERDDYGRGHRAAGKEMEMDNSSGEMAPSFASSSQPSKNVKFYNKLWRCGYKSSLKISESSNNPNRLYFCCQSKNKCGFFESWEVPEDLDDNKVGVVAECSGVSYFKKNVDGRWKDVTNEWRILNMKMNGLVIFCVCLLIIVLLK